MRLDKRILVERKIRRAAAALIEVHGHLEFIDVQDPVHVVHVLREQRLGRCDGDDRLERRGLTHGHLDGVESAPRDPEHADACRSTTAGVRAMRSRCSPSSCSCFEYSRGWRRTAAVAEAPNVDSDTDIAVARKVCVIAVVLLSPCHRPSGRAGIRAAPARALRAADRRACTTSPRAARHPASGSTSVRDVPRGRWPTRLTKETPGHRPQRRR